MMHKSVVQMKLADCRSKALLITLSVLVPCNPNRSIDAPPPIVQRTELSITTMPLDRTGSLSPSSDLIALGVDLDVQAARQNPSQAYLVNLTNYPANDLTPTRSSDGRQLAFISNREGRYGGRVHHECRWLPSHAAHTSTGRLDHAHLEIISLVWYFLDYPCKRGNFPGSSCDLSI